MRRVPWIQWCHVLCASAGDRVTYINIDGYSTDVAVPRYSAVWLLYCTVSRDCRVLGLCPVLHVPVGVLVTSLLTGSLCLYTDLISGPYLARETIVVCPPPPPLCPCVPQATSRCCLILSFQCLAALGPAAGRRVAPQARWWLRMRPWACASTPLCQGATASAACATQAMATSATVCNHSLKPATCLLQPAPASLRPAETCVVCGLSTSHSGRVLACAVAWHVSWSRCSWHPQALESHHPSGLASWICRYHYITSSVNFWGVLRDDGTGGTRSSPRTACLFWPVPLGD